MIGDGAALARSRIASLFVLRGQQDDALRILEEEALPVFEQLGDVREAAVAKGKIADILQARGQLDDALRIRTEDELPVYERLGDVRSAAVTRGQIADILQARGQLDDALRMTNRGRTAGIRAPRRRALGGHREGPDRRHPPSPRPTRRRAAHNEPRTNCPVYERLGDVRSAAIAKGQIADILQARGQLDDALRIRTEDELPIYERLGDMRATAVTKGQIADILQARGQLDEALHLYKQQVFASDRRAGKSGRN